MNRFEVLGNLGSGELTFHHVSEIQLCTPIGVYLCVSVCVCVCVEVSLCVCVYCLNFYHYTFIRELPCVVFSPPLEFI